MAPQRHLSSPSQKRLVIDAAHVATVHTYLAYAAFTSALVVGCALHYKKIVKNGVAGYPEEWFPSVSATIGDWYPERNVFQIMIALTSGPRFALVFLQYHLTRSVHSILPTIVFVTGIIRTLSCGGWVYVTSNDDHDAHDVLMITYIVCNLPWMLGGIACTPVSNTKARRRRRIVATAFFVTIIPLIYFFIQHKVHRVPGAYTHYSFFEWGLILLDVLYDSLAGLDFKAANLQIAIGLSLSSEEGHDNITMPSIRNGDSLSTTSSKSAAGDNMIEHETDIKRLFDSKDISGNNELSMSAVPQNEWRAALSFLSDVYMSFVFWSIFTSLIVTLFYFSVWELGLAGQESALLANLIPTLLGIPSLRSWATSRGGQVTLRLASLVGIWAVTLHSPLNRLFAVTFSNAVLLVAHVAAWTSTDVRQGHWYQGLVLGIGLTFASLSKHANYTNNPLWPIVTEKAGGYQNIGMFVSLIALAELYTRPIEKLTATGAQDKSNSTSAKDQSHSVSNWLPASIAFGSLMFSLHCFLADSGTLIAWSWSGYENGHPKGPLPRLYGSLTFIAQCLGLLISALTSHRSEALRHPLWFAYGAGSAFIMYQYRNWLGYAGGWNVAVFLMSVTPSILQQVAATGKVGRTSFISFLLYVVFIVSNVFTVAYAFVPGGVYFRERSNLVLVAQFLCLSFGFNFTPGLQRARLSDLPSSIKRYSSVLLSIISIISLLVTLLKWPTIGPRPYKPGTGMFNAGIWTIHFGIDNDGHDSQGAIRNLIRDMQLDVVGLLETDLHRTVYGNRDLTALISEDLGYYVDLGPGPNSHTWGAALLSKFPIINSTHHLLPSPHGELAPAIEAVLDVYGTAITFVVSHNGQEEDPLDRELQSTELARIMAASYPRPVVFLGYVVTKPLASRPAPYEILVRDGLVYDIDDEDWDRWCEYILYRGVYRTAYARLSRGIVTDTEMQIGQFVLPKHGVTVSDQSRDSRMLRAFKEDLPQEHWFPPEYYGNQREGGVDGHFYHVFDTPLYYKMPDDAVV